MLSEVSTYILLLGAVLQYCLHIVKKLPVPVDDRFVTGRDIIPIQFFRVLVDILGNEIGSDVLLHDGITLVLVSTENAEDCAVAYRSPPERTKRSGFQEWS